MKQEYWLMNVLLEKSYDHIVGTKTVLCHLFIKEGIIAKIISADQPFYTSITTIDGKVKLLMPSFLEKHVHLDKTFMGNPWVAINQEELIVDQCALEQHILTTLEMTTEKRAMLLLDKLLLNGSTHIRTHVDIYPEIGLEKVIGILQAFNNFSGKLSGEMVAFPQHVHLRTKSKKLVREALHLGTEIVGGVDPATIDGNIEESLFQMMDLAVEANASVDIISMIETI